MAGMMDEEPTYRTLDPEMMSVETTGFDEEPVFRAVVLSECGPAIDEDYGACGKGFACRPTSQFSTALKAAEVIQKVTTEMQARGAEVTVKEEKGQVKVQMMGKSGVNVKIKILVHEENGRTHCAWKRMKGHALDYNDMFGSLYPLIEDCTA